MQNALYPQRPRRASYPASPPLLRGTLPQKTLFIHTLAKQLRPKSCTNPLF
jgi:hypothetical protein